MQVQDLEFSQEGHRDEAMMGAGDEIAETEDRVMASIIPVTNLCLSKTTSV